MMVLPPPVGSCIITRALSGNPLDKAYLSAITENAAWLGAPRTISMTVTVSF